MLELLLLILYQRICFMVSTPFCDYSGIENYPITLKCPFKIENAAIHLKRHGFILSEAFLELNYTIPFASFSDSGIYYCKYFNEIKYTLQINICIYKFSFSKSEMYSVKLVDYRSPSVLLTCDIPTTFPATYKWESLQSGIKLGKNKDLIISLKNFQKGDQYNCTVFYQNYSVASKIYSLCFTSSLDKPRISKFYADNNKIFLEWEPLVYDGGFPISSVTVSCNSSYRISLWTLHVKDNKFTTISNSFKNSTSCFVTYWNSRTSSDSDVLKIEPSKDVHLFPIDKFSLVDNNVVEITWIFFLHRINFDRSFINLHVLEDNSNYQIYFKSFDFNKRSSPILRCNSTYEITINYFMSGKLVAASFPLIIKTPSEKYFSVQIFGISYIGPFHLELNWSSIYYHHSTIYLINLYICEYQSTNHLEQRCAYLEKNITVPEFTHDRRATIENLKPETKYRIKMQHKHFKYAKYSEWSPSLYFTTLSKKPSPPKIIAFAHNKAYLYLEWSFSDDEQSIDGYSLSIFYLNITVKQLLPSNQRSVYFELIHVRPYLIALSSFKNNIRSEEVMLKVNSDLYLNGVFVLCIVGLITFIAILTSLFYNFLSNRKLNRFSSSFTMNDSIDDLDAQHDKIQLYNISSDTRICTTTELDNQGLLQNMQLPYIITKNQELQNNQIEPTLITPKSPFYLPEFKQLKNMLENLFNSEKTTPEHLDESSAHNSPYKNILAINYDANLEYFVKEIIEKSSEFCILDFETLLIAVILSSLKIVDFVETCLCRRRMEFESTLTQNIVDESFDELTFDDISDSLEMDENLREKTNEDVNNLKESLKNVITTLETSSNFQNEVFIKAFQLTKSSISNLKSHIDTINEISQQKSNLLRTLVEKCENIETDFNQMSQLKNDIKIIKESLKTLYNLLMALDKKEPSP